MAEETEFGEGEDVFLNDKDGLFYLGTVVEVDLATKRCLLKFGDNTERWAGFRDLTKMNLFSEGKRDKSDDVDKNNVKQEESDQSSADDLDDSKARRKSGGNWKERTRSTGRSGATRGTQRENSPPAPRSKNKRRKKVVQAGGKHKCDYCSYESKFMACVKTHMRIHTGEKPYTCEGCGKKFSRIEYLKVHYNSVHLALKPYACTLCPKTFTQKHTLNSHVRIHTGEKPFTCSTCQKKFVHSSNLRHHKKKCNTEDN